MCVSINICTDTSGCLLAETQMSNGIKPRLINFYYLYDFDQNFD